jgi:putative aldouronate transport system substrate-binding protein
MSKLVKALAVLVTLALLAPGLALGSIIPFEETIVMSVGRMADLGGTFMEGDDSQNNFITRMLKNILNIEVDVYNKGFEGDGSSYPNDLALNVAGNTLPDTFGIPNNPQSLAIFHQLVENGKLADLTEVYAAELSGDTKAFLEENPVTSQKYTTVDGKLYAVHNDGEDYNTALLMVRKDWLDLLNLEVPKTLEDIKNVALAFVENNPGGADKTVGIIISPDIINGGLFGQWMGILPVFNAFGSYPDIWIEKDGRIVNGAVQPETKEALALLADWFALGILDPDLLSLKNGDEARDNYLSVKPTASGMIFNAWWDPWVQWDGYQDASVKFTEGAEWISVMAPLNGDGKFAPKNEQEFPGGQVVNADFAYPEAVMRAINLMSEVDTFRNPDYKVIYDTYYKPAEGVAGTRASTPFMFTFAQRQMRLNIAEEINKYKATGILDTPDYITDGDKDYIRGAYDWANGDKLAPWYEDPEQDAAPYMFQYVGHYGHDIIGNLYLDAVNSGVYQTMPQAGFASETASDEEFGKALLDLRNTAFYEIIAGLKPIDYFDEFVVLWHELGGEQITEELNDIPR